MNKDFILKDIRIHLYEDNIIVFKGAFPCDNPENMTLCMLVDAVEVPVEINIRDGLEVAREYNMYGAGISQEIRGRVQLLNKNIHEIKLVEKNKNKSKCIFDCKGAALEEMLTGVNASIDYAKKQGEKIVINGWIACDSDADISIYDGSNKIDALIQRKYRRDVADLFDEASTSSEFGIEITIDEVTSRELRLNIVNGSRKRSIKLDLKQLLQAGNDDVLKADKLVVKTLKYLKQRGVKATVKKVINKITRKNDKEDQELYKLFLEQHVVSEEELEKQRNTTFNYEPVISIVIPIYNTPHEFLKELIDSVMGQTYRNWQLCLADGSETDALRKYVEEYSGGDERVCYKLLGYNDGISNNTNGAMEMAEGEFIAFSDHDDLLTPDALYEVVAALNIDANIDCVYTDEDKMDMDGETLFMPHFKSDYNIDLLCSHNYITHLFVARKTLIDQVGWLRSEFDGSQDHDMILRCCEKARRVYHVPKVLYHWRCHKNSTAMNPESKMYCYTAGKKAVQAHWDRLGIPATVEMASNYGHYITRYNWPDEPLVSIVIPNMNHESDLRTCIDSILNKSSYSNLEIVIVENNSTEDGIFDYYQELTGCNKEDIVSGKNAEKAGNIRVVYYSGEFNYSKINNFGVKYTTAEYVLFLNNDTELLSANSIKEMLDIVRRNDVGAVGARLYYSDNTVQHAGVILGVGGIANHAFYNTDRGDVGYFFRSVSVQDLSAVTAACMLTKKTLFEQVGGFSEDLAVAFNDVDYCLKLRKINKLIVYTPFSEWYHYESKSRGYENTPEKQERLERESAVFMSRWNELIESGDPYYNPNFNKKAADYKYNIAD